MVIVSPSNVVSVNPSKGSVHVSRLPSSAGARSSKREAHGNVSLTTKCAGV